MTSKNVKRDLGRFVIYSCGAVFFTYCAIRAISVGKWLPAIFFMFLALCYSISAVIFCKSFRHLLAVLWRSLRGKP